MKEIEYKNFSTRGSDFDAETGIFTCFPSVFGVLDSHRDIVHPGSFKKTLQERGHEVMLFYGHDTREFPIGKPVEQREVQRDDLPNEITSKFPEASGGVFVRNQLSDTSAGKDVHVLLRDGVLKRMSFGFNAIKFDFDEDDGGAPFRNVNEVRLWEYSIVPFSSNPISIITDVKAVVPFKKYPLADRGMAWDGPAQRAATDDRSVLRRISTFVDDSQTNAEGELPKSAFKLPHHLASEDHKTVWRGVTAAMAALLGARGGVQGMSASDRKGAYNHLAKHYREFDEEPPELRDYSESDDLEIGSLCQCDEHWIEEIKEMTKPNLSILVPDVSDIAALAETEPGAALDVIDTNLKTIDSYLDAVTKLQYELTPVGTRGAQVRLMEFDLSIQ